MNQPSNGQPQPARIDQRSEQRLRAEKHTRFVYRYAYSPSADSLATGQPGQDYLTFQPLEHGFVFALCDGVGQSFYGDLAARILGDGLVAWLANQAPATLDAHAVAVALSTFLVDLTQPATRQVDAQPIPAEPLLLQEVLQEKQSQGSEAMFICGRADLPSERLPEGRILLSWMGDMRLYAWRQSGPVSLPGTHQTRQRWSTRDGPLGEVNVYCRPLVANGDPLTRLVAYSDGLASMDEVAEHVHDPSTLQRIITATKTQPASDDVTYFEMLISPVAAAQSLPPRLTERAAAPDNTTLRPDPTLRRRTGQRELAILGGALLIALGGLSIWLLVRSPLLTQWRESVLGSWGLNTGSIDETPTPFPSPRATLMAPEVTSVPGPAPVPTATPFASPTSTRTLPPPPTVDVMPTPADTSLVSDYATPLPATPRAPGVRSRPLRIPLRPE